MITKTWEPKGQNIQVLKDARELLISYWTLHKDKPGRPLGWAEEDILSVYKKTMIELKELNADISDYNEMDYLSFSEKNDDVISMKEVTSMMSDFAVSVPTILLSGELVKKGSTEGDIEVVLCGKEHMVPNIMTIELKKSIIEMFPKKFWSRIKFKYFNGTAEEYPGKHISLYSPLFKRFYDTSIRDGSYFAKTERQNIEVLSSADEVIGEVFRKWNK